MQITYDPCGSPVAAVPGEGDEMSKRNLMWLAAIVVVGVVVGVAVGPLWGVLAGVVVLVASEVVERSRRRRRRAEHGAGAGLSARELIAERRKR